MDAKKRLSTIEKDLAKSARKLQELRIGSLRSWLSSSRRKTINLSDTGGSKSGRIGTRGREAKGFCMGKMEEKQPEH